MMADTLERAEKLRRASPTLVNTTRHSAIPSPDLTTVVFQRVPSAVLPVQLLNSTPEDDDGLCGVQGRYLLQQRGMCSLPRCSPITITPFALASVRYIRGRNPRRAHEQRDMRR
jgi:hypothetical protein